MYGQYAIVLNLFFMINDDNFQWENHKWSVFNGIQFTYQWVDCLLDQRCLFLSIFTFLVTRTFTEQHPGQSIWIAGPHNKDVFENSGSRSEAFKHYLLFSGLGKSDVQAPLSLDSTLQQFTSEN